MKRRAAGPRLTLEHKALRSRTTVCSVLLFFFLFSVCGLFSQQSGQETEFRRLILEGKIFYGEGDYGRALTVFLEALIQAKSTSEMSEACLNISLVHYVQGNNEKASEYLLKLYQAQPDFIVDEIHYPQGFIELMHHVKRTVEKTAVQKETPTAWKGKAVEEKRPKKGKTLWLVLGGVAVVAVGVTLYLLMKKPALGDMAVDSTPTGAKVFLDGVDKGVRTNCTLSDISAGKHTLLLILEGYGKWEGDVEIKAGQTARVSCILAVFQYEFMTKWGSQGSGDGQFQYPRGIAVDSSGSVYVSDTDNDRIQKFTSGGIFITKWGSRGKENGQFKYPRGVAVDSAGFVYVADMDNFRIQKFTPDGSFVTKWGSEGSGDGQLNYPRGIAVDNSGFVYVTDTQNDRIQKFTSDGSFITKWGSRGSGNGQFIFPYGIGADGSGNIYVTDTGNHRVQKFSNSGAFIGKWGSEGTGDGQFKLPHGMDVEGSGYVFVVDKDNHRIQKFMPDGSFIMKWGNYGSGDGQFMFPVQIALEESGEVYVADTDNHRIQKFQMSTQTQAAANIQYYSSTRNTSWGSEVPRRSASPKDTERAERSGQNRKVQREKNER